MTRDNDEYKLDNGRVIVSTGGTCPFECSYCYTYSPDFRSFPRKSSLEVVSDLSTFANRIDLVQLGCDTEMFLDQNKAVELIRGAAGLDKDVSFATKMYLTDRTIEQLVDVQQEMQKPRHHSRGTENYLTAFVSLTGLETASALEPKAPSPEKRMQTMKRLHDAGIPTYVFIKPLLPSVTSDELKRLFDATGAHCDGYVIGLMYSDEEMISRLGVEDTGVRDKMGWALDQRDWIIFEDERIARLVDRERIFNHSTDAINHVRKRRYQEAIVEGVQNMVRADFFESSLYSARLAVPDNIKQVTVMARTDGIAPGLTLQKNVFTGESFDVPDIDNFDAFRKFYEGNTMVIDQPPNAYLAIPRTILLEDGRLFAHTAFMADFDLAEATTQSLLENLDFAVKNRDSFVRVCEGLDDRIIRSTLDPKTFLRVRQATTTR